MSTNHPAPVRRSAPQRRAEIRAAARALALEEGLSALTLRAIASRAGVTPALVAHYEPRMEDLVASTFADVVSAELSEVRAALDERAPAGTRLRQLVAMLLDGEREEVTTVWVEAWAFGRRNSTLAAAVREQMDAWQDAVAQLLVDESGLDGQRAASAARHLLGMIDGLNAQALVHWHDTPDREELVLAALAAASGARPPDGTEGPQR